MKLRSIALASRSIRGVCVAAFLAAGLMLAPATLIPTASASCSDVELVFARGRLESPGAGVVGNNFVSALRSRVNKNVSLYAVRYPADTEIDIGANDMSAHVQNTINGCPNTRIVLGGYSLGAAVTDVVMAAPGPMFGFTNPLPPGADQHIAAIAQAQVVEQCPHDRGMARIADGAIVQIAHLAGQRLAQRAKTA